MRVRTILSFKLSIGTFIILSLILNINTSASLLKTETRIKKIKLGTAALLHDDVGISYIVRPKVIHLSMQDLIWRYKNRHYPYIASPVKLHVVASDKNELCLKVSKPFYEKKLCNAINNEELVQSGKYYTLTVDYSILPYVSPSVIESKYRTKTYDLYVDLKELSSKSKLKAFLKFLSNTKDYDLIKKRILILKRKGRKYVNIKSIAFPRFARENYNTYAHFYGPNCFHAALAFNNYGVENNRNINYKIESNLNYNFINNYEYFNALKKYHVKVNYEKEKLKFGDVIVFYSRKISKDGSHYKSYKHGSVYIGNGFVYTKGSKYAQHPYRIAYFKNDFANWKAKLKDIGIHIYRPKHNL